MELFVKKMYRFQPLTFFASSSIIDFWLGSEDAHEYQSVFLDIIDQNVNTLSHKKSPKMVRHT